jgi:hypothetical protein
MSRRLHLAGIAIAVTAAVTAAGAQTTQTQTPPPIPVPQPFPTAKPPSSSQPPPTTTTTTTTTPAKPPAATSTSSQPPAATTNPTTVYAGGRPTETDLGAPIYPAADFLDAYDAGKGQRYYIFGTAAYYADIVTYYKNKLKDSGRELLKSPPMQQFDLGRFKDDTMAYPPSVVIKDYTWGLDGQRSDGYLFVSGTVEKRYRTIIQIVPNTPK